jgi:hypothetical protein
VPISIVSIVDTDRIWFKSRHGLPDVSEIGRDPGLCASAILGSDPWVVTDAPADPRTLANPLVAGEFGLRFYAGVPLTTHDGYNLGTLCVIDREPRTLRPDEAATLGDLAVLVVRELELRLEARREVARQQVVSAGVLADKDRSDEVVRAAAMEHDRPSDVLRVVNEALLLDAAVDDPRFCTLVYAHLRPAGDASTLALSSAGHPLPRLLRRDGTVEAIGEFGTLAGCLNDVSFPDRRVRMGQGDAVVFYGTTSPASSSRSGPARRSRGRLG